jgi:hypothetical protein
MKVENCFYLRLLPTTKPERVSAMCSNLGLTVSVIEAPHAVLKLNNLASRNNIEEKLDKSKLFAQVTFLKNFVVS